MEVISNGIQAELEVVRYTLYKVYAMLHGLFIHPHRTRVVSSRYGYGYGYDINVHIEVFVYLNFLVKLQLDT